DNNLKALPDSIGGLTALKELGVSWNKLESLPDAMGGLTALTRLHVCGNKLKALPDSIGGLKALKVINLDGNELLTSIPESWLTLGHGFIIKLVGTGLSESDIQRLREMTRH
ncbi:MAG: leucine-rich repeat domain-containing protein, partial [Chlamydiia bacterium]|nr:leucine-rich repeat domain-containing protein [Chlamydiia bacterium]